LKQTEKIITLLDSDKNIALVSDAGTPGISDPGGKLVQAVLEKFGDDVKIESVPGPSATTAALSISGVPTDKFVFMGFPPNKKGRQTFIAKILISEYPVVVYESKHRILKLLEEMKDLAKEKEIEDAEKIKNYELRTMKGREPFYKKIKQASNSKFQASNLTSVVVCRELSKMHETVYRGDIDTIINKIQADKNDQKGEFTVIIGR
jgi:16S rRNA (cytidine1402-2'-O)-methyltransferase